MWTSWKHEDSDLSEPLAFEQKVEIFYQQTFGWQLHIADLVANGGETLGEFKLGKAGYAVPKIRHSGFAVLQICLSYIELVGSLVHSAERSSTKTFESGLRSIRGLIDPSCLTSELAGKLYVGVRCGLYHEGRTRPGIGLGQPPDGNAIAYDRRHGVIGISPERLPRVLKAHLEEFRQELLSVRDPGLCRRFEKRFDSGFSELPKRKRVKRRRRQ